MPCTASSRSHLGVALAVALATAACATARPGPSSPGDARPSLLAADDALSSALAVGPPAYAIRFLADDVLLALPGAESAQGKPAVRALLAPLSETIVTLHRASGATSADGRAGYTLGSFVSSTAGGASTFGKYVAFWRAGEGGWRVEAFLARPAKREPAPLPPESSVAAGWQGSPAPADPEALARAALAADGEFAALSIAKGYTVAFESFADPRALCFTDGDFQWGAVGVRAVFAGRTPAEQLAWTPRAGGAAASGDLAWTSGLASMTIGAGASATRSWMTYLTIWARQPDGSWKWLVHAGAERPAPR